MTSIHHTTHPVNVRKNLYSPVPEDETEEQKYKRYWKAADEAKHGKMPDPSTEEGRIQWLTVIGTRFHGFFLKCGMVNNTARRDFVKETKDILVARNRYEEDFAFELAEICLQIRRDGIEGKTVLDTLKERETMATTKQAPTHETTPEQKASIKAAFSKPVDPIQKRADALWSAFDAADRELDIVSGTDMTPTRFKVLKDLYGTDSAYEAVKHLAYNQLTAANQYRAIVKERQAPLKKVTPEQMDSDLAASVGATADELNAAFPRCKVHNLPLEDGKCPTCELNNSMSPDEKPAPKKKDPTDTAWFQMYQNAQETWGYSHDFILTEILKTESAKDTGLNPAQTMMKIKAYHDEHSKAPEPPVSKPAETSTASQPQKAQEPPKGETGIPIAAPISEGPKIAPLPANSIQEKAHHMEAPVIAYTTIIINEHRVNVTAREGATAEQVHDTVLALVNGLRLIAADETIKSYAAVVDGRDKTIPFKGQSKAAEATSQPQPTPNGNGHASTPPASDSGTVACMMIEVGTTYTGGKPALKFSCDGYENPLQFAKQPGEMVKLLSKIKQANGAPFTAEDLIAGKKFGGTWRVAWKDGMGKDEKMHRNVIDVLPA